MNIQHRDGSVYFANIGKCQENVKREGAGGGGPPDWFSNIQISCPRRPLLSRDQLALGHGIPSGLQPRETPSTHLCQRCLNNTTRALGHRIPSGLQPRETPSTHHCQRCLNNTTLALGHRIPSGLQSRETPSTHLCQRCLNNTTLALGHGIPSGLHPRETLSTHLCQRYLINTILPLWARNTFMLRASGDVSTTQFSQWTTEYL
ncbi:hypothetical protein J6590_047753 [Homalodisca vitripennis]|nr:hypothetical protein J6590_047753 [Homalodisca vitripennis]